MNLQEPQPKTKVSKEETKTSLGQSTTNFVNVQCVPAVEVSSLVFCAGCGAFPGCV
jgi:hypothetical protein